MSVPDKVKRDITDCVFSLCKAIQDAGGALPTPVGDVLDMTLGDFISTIAGQNGIRFVFVPTQLRNEEKE